MVHLVTASPSHTSTSLIKLIMFLRGTSWKLGIKFYPKANVTGRYAPVLGILLHYQSQGMIR